MDKKVIPNPNGANSNLSDPREIVCWEYYVKGLNKGSNNGYAAAKKAGYSEASAKHITTRDWFTERLANLKRKELVVKSEKIFERTLEYNPEYTNEQGHVKVDSSLLRVQTDVAKFVASTQGKNKGYSTKGDDALAKMADKEQTQEQIEKGKLFEQWLKNQT